MTTALVLGAMTELSLAPVEAGIEFKETAPEAAQVASVDGQDRLMIVNGDTGRIV